MLNSLIKKRAIFLFLFLVMLIISILVAAYIIDLKNTSQSLSGYENLKQNILDVAKADNISDNNSFNKMLAKVAGLETKTMTKEQRLIEFMTAWQYLYEAYQETNKHELYKLSQEFAKFAKANYTDSEFRINVQCLDPVCAQHATPKEIITLIEEINNSSVSAELKNNYAGLLRSFSYINDDQSEVKVIDYLSLADTIKKNEEFIKAGIDLKIYNGIVDYIKKSYPELFKKYSNQLL